MKDKLTKNEYTKIDINSKEYDRKEFKKKIEKFILKYDWSEPKHLSDVGSSVFLTNEIKRMNNE